jgi:hypothetical protein
METASDPPEQEKYRVGVSRPGCTGMHYVTHRSNRMQKKKFGVKCPGTADFLLKLHRAHRSMNTSGLTFHGSDAPECTR